MSDFSELIKNFDKTRDYMRDFYIYGYKTRTDFQYKSLRTYDNEKRRIENWLGNLIKFDTTKKGKQVAISLDSGQLLANPLYQAYKSKSFTDNDICLHFFILDQLKNETELSVEEITDRICTNYGKLYDSQTVRLKLREYVSEGILITRKYKKSLLYRLSKDYIDTLCSDQDGLMEAVTFFSEVAPFGVIGSYLLDSMNYKNELFLYKHHYIVHTLEDHILLDLLTAIMEKRTVEVVNYGKKQHATLLQGVPMKVSVSFQTGRRYIVMYQPAIQRFNSYRLDYIKSVTLLTVDDNYDSYLEKFEQNDPFCWGVTLGNMNSPTPCEEMKMILKIDEVKEQYILNRLKREGRNGVITKISENTFSYTVQVYNTNEMMNWVKTFIGRIVSLEGSNQTVIHKLYEDIIRMKNLYTED